MNPTRRWSALFGIEPGEGRQVFLFLAFSFFLGFANTYSQTAAFTLFLSRYTAQTLSYVYIINAVVVTALTALYLRIGRRLSFRKSLAINLSFLLVLLAIFWAGMLLFHADWIIFLLPVLFQVVINFGILAFWPLANRLFTVRQGKRLFGLIGSGQWIAIVVTGFLMGPLSTALGTQNLLGLALVGILGALGLLWVITHSYQTELVVPQAGPTSAEVKPAPPAAARPLSPWRERYILLIFSLVAVWWVGFFLMDNLFYDRAAAQYPDPARLAGFLGIYLSGLGILTLIMNFFLAGRIVSRFGLRTSLLMLPSMLGASALVLVVTGSIGGSLLILFWLTVAAKLADMTLGFSVDRSVQSLLYQPLPADRRGQIQALAEGAVQPIGNGLAGVILLVLGAAFSSTTLPLMVAILAVSILWVAIAFALGKEYPRRLIEAISKRRLELSAVDLANSSTLQILRQGLNDPHPGLVIYAANCLEEVRRAALVQALPELLKHPAPEVRQNTYERIERLKLDEVLAELRGGLGSETYPEARRAGIRALLSFGKAEDLAKGTTYLNHPLPQVRLGAIVGMIRAGGIEGVLVAGARLLELAHSARVEERIQACQSMGEIGMQQYYQPLVPLLKDPEPGVRQAALHASGLVKSPALWPLVIAALADARVRGSAASALIAGGSAALPAIRTAFDQPGSSAVVRQLAMICGQIKTSEAVELLHSKMEIADLETRGQVLVGLNRAGYHAGPAETARWLNLVGQEVGFSAWLWAAWLDLAGSQPGEIVRLALQGELEHSRERIFALLACLGDRQTLGQAWQTLRHPSPERRAYALEIIDTQLPQEVKPALIPLLDESVPEQRLKRLAARFPQARLTPEQRLEEIACRSLDWNTAWLAATALFAGGQLRAAWLSQAAGQLKELDNPIIQDTLDWTNSRQSAYFTAEPEANPGGEIMFSIIEKVLILKKTSLFTETPDDALAEVAQALAEVQVPAGQLIFDKGAPGSSMYLIASGKVRVFDGAHTLNYLGEGDVFGEMAALDPGPRSASVEAVEDSQLLWIDQAQLYELVESRLEVARGIIQVLSRHLRQRMQDLDRLQNVLERPMRA